MSQRIHHYVLQLFLLNKPVHLRVSGLEKGSLSLHQREHFLRYILL